MEIKNITDQARWDGWLKNNGACQPFAQSWQWGEILIAEGKEVERLALVDGGEILAQAQVVFMPLLFGWKYAFCPKGLVISPPGTPTAEPRRTGSKVEKLMESLSNYLKTKNCVFFRIEPSDLLVANCSLLITQTKDINPRATMILDLSGTEENILKKMHSKTRYNIRLAQKKGIELTQEKNSELFYKLLSQTGARDGFKLHARCHYDAILNSPLSFEINAWFEGKPVASAVFVGFGDTFTYLFGASDYATRALMAPQLIQWEGIKLGKKLGYKKYDFFGVAPRINQNDVKGQNEEEKFEYDPKHQYAGVSRFKAGFGGQYYEAPGTLDLLISPKKYRIYRLMRALRRLV